MNSNHIAAPITIKIDDKEYTLSPLTMKDLRELERYFQDSVIEDCKRLIAGLSSELASMMLKDAVNESKKIQLGSQEFIAKISSVDGLAKILSLSLRNKHPDMSVDKCLDCLTPSNIESISNSLAEMTGLAGGDNDSDFSTIPPPKV